MDNGLKDTNSGETAEDEIVIASAVRSAVGSFDGVFKNTSSQELGSAVITEAIKRASLRPSDIDEVIMGQILTAGLGQNSARQAAIQAGIPYEKTAIQINQLCGSGLRSVSMAYQSVKNGDSSIVIAGGQENMSLAPHSAHLRSGVKMGSLEFVDTMLKDGLLCSINGYHMGITAENVASKWQISREEQDRFAYNSQKKAATAQQSGDLDAEIIEIEVKSRKETKTISRDEYIRPNTSLESLAKLRPAFNKEGSVTAGNASGINDGAACVVVMRLSQAEKLGLTPLAKIKSWATAGTDPAIMGTGPIPATKKALAKANWKINDLDLIESNEAFASQSIAVARELAFDMAKVNIKGGAIAIGHPIGASGARILVSLLYSLKQHKLKKGLATLCIGGGMGISMCLETYY